MINCLLSVPLSSAAFKNEVDTIKCIARNNNIRLDIDNIIRKKRTARALDNAFLSPVTKKFKKMAIATLSWQSIQLTVESSQKIFSYRLLFY